MLNAKLYAASADGDLATVRDCLARGADVNFENEKRATRTPLMTACFNGHLEVVKFLVTNGANEGFSSGLNGRTAIQWAKSRGFSEIVDYLSKPVIEREGVIPVSNVQAVQIGNMSEETHQNKFTAALVPKILEWWESDEDCGIMSENQFILIKKNGRSLRVFYLLMKLTCPVLVRKAVKSDTYWVISLPDDFVLSLEELEFVSRYATLGDLPQFSAFKRVESIANIYCWLTSNNECRSLYTHLLQLLLLGLSPDNIVNVVKTIYVYINDKSIFRKAFIEKLFDHACAQLIKNAQIVTYRPCIEELSSDEPMFTVIKQLGQKQQYIPVTTPLPDDIHIRMNRLLTTGELSDFRIVLDKKGDKVINAHKVILSSCLAFFSDLFQFHPNIEEISMFDIAEFDADATDEELTLQQEVLQEFIYCCYTGRTPEFTSRNAFLILTTLSYFIFKANEDPLASCLEYIYANVNKENVEYIYPRVLLYEKIRGKCQSIMRQYSISE